MDCTCKQGSRQPTSGSRRKGSLGKEVGQLQWRAGKKQVGQGSRKKRREASPPDYCTLLVVPRARPRVTSPSRRTRGYGVARSVDEPSLTYKHLVKASEARSTVTESLLFVDHILPSCGLSSKDTVSRCGGRSCDDM